MVTSELASHITTDEASKSDLVEAVMGLVKVVDNRLEGQSPAAQSGSDVRRVTLKHEDTVFQLVRRETPGHTAGDLWISTRELPTKQLEHGPTQPRTVELPRVAEDVEATKESIRHLMVGRSPAELHRSAADFRIMSQQLAAASPVPERTFAVQPQHTQPDHEFTTRAMLAAVAPNVTDLISRRAASVRQTARRTARSLGRKPVAA